MKISRYLAVALCCAPVLSLRAQDAGALPTIPASLTAPENQERALVLTAKGVQIYECRAVPGEANKFEWSFKAPEAELFDAQGKTVGRHYAGPTWELTTGGRVVGKLKAKADAPDGKGVAWLLLEGATSNGGGFMALVRSVQRLSTVGGKPPAEAADQSKLGQERRVEYSATYVFYIDKPKSE